MKLIALCFLFMGCNTSCEKQGGKWLQDGYYTIWQTIGGVSYPQQYPIYVCKKEKIA
jgi:hypothetical protein